MEFNEQIFQNMNMDKYAKKFSEKKLWLKATKKVQSVGLAFIYKSLQLYYVTQNPSCPKKVKAGIYAALGYFITPLDLIPDFAPVVGYTDDASGIAFALTMAHMYINDTVREQAQDKIRSLFGDTALKEVGIAQVHIYDINNVST